MSGRMASSSCARVTVRRKPAISTSTLSRAVSPSLAGGAAGFLGGLPLAVVEVRRHGEDRLPYRHLELLLGAGLERAQDLRAHLHRRHGTPGNLESDRPALAFRETVRRQALRLRIGARS